MAVVATVLGLIGLAVPTLTARSGGATSLNLQVKGAPG